MNTKNAYYEKSKAKVKEYAQNRYYLKNGKAESK